MKVKILGITLVAAIVTGCAASSNGAPIASEEFRDAAVKSAVEDGRIVGKNNNRSYVVLLEDSQKILCVVAPYYEDNQVNITKTLSIGWMKELERAQAIQSFISGCI